MQHVACPRGIERRARMRTDAEFATAAPGWVAREAHGIAFHHVDRDEMAAIQPGLAPRFIRGTFTPGWYSIDDPKLYTLALAEHFRARGGRIEIAAVTRLSATDSGIAASAATSAAFKPRASTERPVTAASATSA